MSFLSVGLIGEVVTTKGQQGMGSGIVNQIAGHCYCKYLWVFSLQDGGNKHEKGIHVNPLYLCKYNRSFAVLHRKLNTYSTRLHGNVLTDLENK